MCSVCATFVGAPLPKCSLLRGHTESPAGNTINDNHDYPEAKHRPFTENTYKYIGSTSMLVIVPYEDCT